MSLIFYTWGDLSLSWILLLSVAFNFCLGQTIAAVRDNALPCKAWLIFAVFANLGLLLFFKYANFAIANLNNLLSWLHLSKVNFAFIPLPLGISFFTFHCISYLVDIYREKCRPQKDFFVMFLYIALFPQLVAGPIIRYHEIASQFLIRRISAEGMAEGIRRFILGLSKKVLIANPVGAISDKGFSLPIAHIGPDVAWVCAICYALQIYFDFSGYSDMACGLGRMFGFRFPENFNDPYQSLSIRDFWRRWHITLSSWFRDYVYIPLGGNRHGKMVECRNLLTVFCLCGLWHGASWNFLVWGLFHGIFLSLERTPFGDLLDNKLPRILRWFYTALVVLVGWIFFRLETLPEALAFLASMFACKISNFCFPVQALVDSYGWFVIGAGLYFSTSLPARLGQISVSMTVRAIPAFRITRLCTCLVLLLICTVELTAGASNPFIYFRF